MGICLIPSSAINENFNNFASWSYSGFMDFRIRLAKEIGINLEEMKYFEILSGFNNKQKGKDWENVNDDIVPLLIHSDCDGNMPPETCAKVVLRLRQLISTWKNGDYDKQQAVKLADAMDRCVRENNNLEFI